MIAPGLHEGDAGGFTLHRPDFQSGLYDGGFGRAVAMSRQDIARLAEAG